jgi:broad specificity phosphatase PhoE
MFVGLLQIGYAKRMKIYFARHGQTNYNQQDLSNADPSIDVHLTALGIEQANELAESLKEITIECIFVSELKRTQQTAQIVNASRDVPVIVAPLLNDHHSGFEGRPAKLLMDAMDAAEDKWTARFNDGESVEDMKARVARFLEELKSQPYSEVLVITSGWIIHAAAAIIQNISNDEAWKLDVVQGSYLEMEI